MAVPQDTMERQLQSAGKQGGDDLAADIRSYRYERKFLIENHSPFSIEGAVRFHPAQFHGIYPARCVNNIYLDTPLLRNYRDAVDGISSRLKARIRWYGDLFSFVDFPSLELKGKEGTVCHKSVYPLKGFNFSKGIGTQDIYALLLNSGLPAEINNYLSLMKPVLVNRYRRKYWCSRDGRYRLTLDHKLWFGGFFTFNNKHLQHAQENTSVIVEVKYDPEADDSFADISNRFAFRQTRSSKYVSGMEHIYQLGHSR
jgi:hypothetical protein